MMKKSLLILLSALLLIGTTCFTACDSWMQDDDFYSDIENDVKVANAKQIQVYVRYAMTRQGKTDPDGYKTFKVEIPQTISATTETEFGFVRWAAFSTDFLATGDNQTKNKDVYFIDDEDYNTRLLPQEITAPSVVFEDATKPTTKVTINVKRNDIFLVPIVAQRPAVSLTIPARGSNDVVRNMSVRISFTKPMDEESFKNSEGVFDTITITQGTQTFTSEGDIEIDSEDITSRFQNPVFSKNKKMITLQFKDSEVDEGYASQSSVTISISKEVKDLYGFTMVDDEKVSFTVGSNKDTLAPRISSLTGGIGNDFTKFQGVYQDEYYAAGTSNQKKLTDYIGQKTKILYGGAKDAPKDDVEASFFGDFSITDPDNEKYSRNFYNNRVGNKIIIRVYAEDIAGSGEGQNSDGIETDVSVIGIRSKLLYDMDGNPSTQSQAVTSYAYIPQYNQTSLEGGYKELVNQAYGSSEVVLETSKGTLLEYDLSGLDDGLIQIDVAAVDLIANSGFGNGGNYSDEYGNGYASLFVVKDTTPPALIAQGGVKFSLNQGNENYTDVDLDKYYNKTEKAKLTVTALNAPDAGHERLRSRSIKWIVKPVEEQISSSASGWDPISTKKSGFNIADVDKEQSFAYALKDDLGNISKAVLPEVIKFDCTNPAFNNLTWQADTGSTEGIASSNKLDKQTLIIPLKEITAGLTTIELSVAKGGLSNPAWGSPFAASDLSVKAGDTSLTKGTDYTISGTTLTFKTPRTGFDTNLTIKGITISDKTEASELEGNYVVQVTATDAAANSTTTTLTQDTTVSIDSTKPAVTEIYIPNIKKAFSISETSDTPAYEYWIDYTSLDTSKSNPRTDVYIDFNEATSGAKVFNFTGSTIKLTGDSKIYKCNSTFNSYSNTEIESKIDTTAQTLSIKNPNEAVKNESGTASAKVKISNVELTSTSNAKISLVIGDTATNTSTAAASIKSKDGDTDIPGITTFKYSSINPVTSSLSLSDRGNDDNDGNHTTAESGYTSEIYINTSVYINDVAADNMTPVYQLVIKGPAEFETGSENTTKIYNGDTEIPSAKYEFTDSKTITFKKSGTYIFIDGKTLLNIENLKLTGSDGDKKVEVKAKNISQVTGSYIDETITLDTHAPDWTGKGLYTGEYSGSVNNDYVYPTPTSDGSSEGLTLTGRSDLYFYRNGSIRIDAKFDEDNPKLDTNDLPLINWKGSGLGTNGTDYAYMYGTYSGDYKANVYDMAGNKSPEKAFHIERVTSLITEDNSRKNIKINLENEVTLEVPTGANAEKNTFLNGVRSPEGPRDSQTYDYYNGSQNAKIWVFNYVLKPFDGNYKLKVPVHSYAAGGEKSVPIEEYGVSHQYTSFPSTSTDCSTDSFTPRSPNWHPYVKNSESKDDGHLSSYVDSNGDIIITLPNHNCPPVSLWLKDGCENTAFILLNPGLKDKLGRDLTVCTSRPDDLTKQGFRNEAVAYVFDNVIGVGGHNGTGTSEKITEPEDCVTIVSKSDITFYKEQEGKLPSLELTSLSDACRFPYVSGKYGEGNLVTEPLNYTLKSKIIVWDGDGTPAYEKFYDNSITGSTWYAWKECYDEGGASSAFTLKNNLPVYDNAAHNTEKYNLYYILEDRVGNYEVRQLKKGGVTDWLYDVTPPALSVSVAQNVNYIDDDESDNQPGANYYSDKSYLDYTISDKQSGIQNNGSVNDPISGYSSFAGRVQNYTPTTGYSLNGVKPKDSSDNDLDEGIPGTISVSGVKDWAGNEAASVGLENGGSNQWIKQSAPELTTTGLSAKNTTSWSKNNSYYNISSTASSNDTVGGGVVLNITSTAQNTNIDVYLKSSESAKLLGWIVRDSKLTSPKAFYSKDSTELTQLTYNESTNTYTYSYEKTNGNGNDDTWTAWNTIGDKYFYPVNRAGLISEKPIRVSFVKVLIPELQTGYTYSGNGTITSIASTMNYTKTGARFNFTATNNPTECWISYGTGNDGYWGTYDDDHVTYTLSTYWDSTNEYYSIPLDSTTLKTLSSKELRIQLFLNNERSKAYNLYGPAGKNLWTFDETPPSIGVVSVVTKKSNGNTPAKTNVVTTDADETYYIEGDTAVIKFSTDDSQGTWEYKKEGESTYKSMTLTNDTYELSATDTAVTYYFHATDKAKNVSGDKTVKIKKDTGAPEGNLTYKIKKGSTYASSTEVTNWPDRLDAAYDSDDNKRDITYSSVDSSPYFAQYLEMDFTNITDAGSGIQGFYYKKDGGIEEDLPLTDKKTCFFMYNTYTGATFEVYVKDKINNQRTLKTFKLTADAKEPKLEAASNAVQAKTNEEGAAASSEGIYKSGSKYFIAKAKTVLNFTIDDTTADYQWKVGAANWTSIPDAYKKISGTDTKTLTVTFDTPENETTYLFKAVDKVENVSGEISYTIELDDAKPQGTFSYIINDTSAVSGAGYKESDGASSIIKNVIYNTSKVSSIELNFSNITDKVSDTHLGSGIAGYYVDGVSKTLSNGKYNLTLDSTDGFTHSYVITVKDNVGNERTLMTLNVTADGSAPGFALKEDYEKEGKIVKPVRTRRESYTEYNGEQFGSDITWYLKRDDAIIYFDGTYESTATYEMKTVAEGENADEINYASITFTEPTQGMSLRFTAPTTPTTYYFKATDNVGNKGTEFSVKLVADMTAPSEGDVTYSFADASGNAVTNTDTATYYIIEDDGTIKYNSNKIKKIVLTPAITDGTYGCGVDSITYDGTHTLNNNAANTLDLSGDVTYTIKAKDKLGNPDKSENEVTIKTIVLKAYNGVKVSKTQHPPYSGLQYVPTYNPETGTALAKADANTKPSNGSPDYRIPAFEADSGNYSMSSTSTEATDSAEIKIWTYGNSGNDSGWPTEEKNAAWNIRWLADDSDTTFTVPFVKDSLPSDSLSYALTYHSIVQPTAWTSVAASDIANGKFTVTIDKSKVLYRHTFIFIWYKDAFGNITVYNIVCPEKTNQNWWCPASLKDSTPTADDFSHFQYVASGTYNIGRIGPTSSGAGEITAITGSEDSESGNIVSRITQFFNNVQNTLVRETEAVVEKPVNEKETKTAKKAAKKAKASAKKAKKTSAKATAQLAEQPLAAITDQTVALETTKPDTAAEFVTSEIAQVSDAVTASSGVEPAASAQTQAAATAEAAVTASTAEAPEKKSSSTAVIVVMLAILSSCAGAWYVLKTRKRK